MTPAPAQDGAVAAPPRATPPRSLSQIGGSAEIDQIVRARQVDQAYRQAALNAIVTPFASVLLAYVTRHAGPMSWRLLWIGVVTVSCAALFAYSRYRRSRPTTLDEAPRLARLAKAFAFWQGASWGLGMLLLNPSFRDPEMTLLVFAVLAGAATALPGQAALPWVYVIGFIPNWTFVVVAASQGPPPWPTLAVLVVALASLLAFHSRGLTRRLEQALRLVVVNETMSAQLAEAHRDATQANEQLVVANAALHEAMERHRELAMRDELTGAFNRRHLLTFAAHELERGQRSGARFTLLLIDLDHFKQVNDGFGHSTGDAVLKRFVQVAQRQLRSVDVLARYGGEEFAVLAPDTDYDGALALAERIRATVADTSFVDLAPELGITISVGLSSFRPGDTIDLLLERADAALYAAKSQGRNRVARSTAPALPTM